MAMLRALSLRDTCFYIQGGRIWLLYLREELELTLWHNFVTYDIEVGNDVSVFNILFNNKFKNKVQVNTTSKIEMEVGFYKHTKCLDKLKRYLATKFF